MQQLNALGHKLFGIISDFSYWIFAIVMVIDIIKKFIHRDMEGCVKALLQGSIGFACIYAITWILTLVKEVFSAL